jgi:SagB-type dehydrogenase family enzyme
MSRAGPDSAALEYHRATNVPVDGTDEDEQRSIETLPHPFKDYGNAERLPLDASVAGPLLQDGAGIVRSRELPQIGRTIHFRGYSSAGALYPVEAYVAAADGLYSFDALTPGLVRLADGDARAAVGAATRSEAEAFVVLTGIHARTGWKYLERGYRHVWWDAGTMLANLLALAAADGLGPQLHTAFDDAQLNRALGVDGEREYALAVLALGTAVGSAGAPLARTEQPRGEARRFPQAEAAHRASSLEGDAVERWRSPIAVDEPSLDRDDLVRAIRRRGSVREYAGEPLPREELAAVLAWSEAAIPADAPSVVRQLVTVAAVEGLAPGIYDAELHPLAPRPDTELRERVGFAAMEQEHPALAGANVFQLADLEDVVRRLGDRGYRWAQLEAGIRAGRLQIGAFMRGWGAAASTFFDDEVSRLLETHEAPMLMVAIGRRARSRRR